MSASVFEVEVKLASKSLHEDPACGAVFPRLHVKVAQVARVSHASARILSSPAACHGYLAVCLDFDFHILTININIRSR